MHARFDMRFNKLIYWSCKQ